MGALSSKLKQQQQNPKWTWRGPPGDHSPYPIDPMPYPGPDLLYCFVDIMASYAIIRNQINLGPQAVTTDIENFSEDLADCYREGFILNDFVKVPGLRSTVEIQDWGIKTPYQAILSKPSTTRHENLSESWQLQIEKRLLSTRTLAFDEMDEDNDLMNTVRSYANAGGRLVCVTPVGYLKPQTLNQQYGVIGVELFFNIPRHNSSLRYSYHAVKLPANYFVVPDATQSIQQIQCDADFLGQLRLFLSQGWKLVDICMDTLALAEAFRGRSISHRVDTIWFFEKEQSELHDHTPKYEGVIIEYLHKIQSTLDGENPCRDWRPVVAGMGVMGWELAAMVQTPSLIQSSFTKYTMKMLMIFQRRLDANFEKLKAMKATSSLRSHGKANSSKSFGIANFLSGKSLGTSTGSYQAEHKQCDGSMYRAASTYPHGMTNGYVANL